VKAAGGLVASRCSTRKRCSSWWVPVRRRIAEVGRTPSGSKKRDDRCRLGRKPGSHTKAREREPDHRRSLRRASAGAHRWQKGGGSSKLGHPHHVRAGAIGERDAVSFVLRHERGARSDCRRKTPWIGNAHAFHEAPAEPVLAAFEPKHGTRQKRPMPTSPEEATGVPEVSGILRARRKKTPSHVEGIERRSGKRAVKRGSPQSRLHRVAPSLPVPGSRVFGRAERHTREDAGVDGHGAARLRDESEPRAGAARPRTGTSRCAGKRREHECSSGNGFGVQKSIGRIAGRDARGRYQAHHGHARPSSKESPQRA